MPSIDHQHSQPRESAAVSFRGDAIWIAGLLFYFVLLLAARIVWGGESLNWDDAELPVAADLYRLGYGPQLPLYHWYQNALFDLFGISLFSIGLGRALIRFLTAAIVYFLARQVVRPLPAFAATLGLELNIHFAWDAQRAFSHNNAAILFGVMAVFLFWRARRCPNDWGRWAAFGLSCGLGLLSKYNFLLVPFTLLIAALTHRAARASLLWSRLAVSFALAVLIAAVPYHWIASNLTLATGAADSLVVGDGGWLGTRLAGLAELIKGLLSNVAMPILLGLLLLRIFPCSTALSEDEERERAASSQLGSFLIRYLLCFSVILLVGLVAAGVGNVRDRWLLPVFTLIGPTVVLMIWHRISREGQAVLMGVCCLIALGVLIGYPLESRTSKDRANAPFGAVAEAIDTAGASDGTYIVAPFQWVAGNLKLRRSGMIVDDHRLLRFSDRREAPFLLVVKNDTRDIEGWTGAFGNGYAACQDRQDAVVDTQDSTPDRLRLDLAIRWICPAGPPILDK